MARIAKLGGFEIIVLAVIIRLGDQAYGVSVRQEIEERTGRRVSIGAVYTTLDRLQRKGFTKSRKGEPAAHRGGRAKRYFRVTALGSTTLAAELDVLNSVLDAMDLGLATR